MKKRNLFHISTYLLAVMALLDYSIASQAAPSASQIQQPQPWMELVKFAPFILLFFYAIYYQPKKREKEHKNLINSLQTGQKVLLNNGMYGSIVEISQADEVAKIEIADNVIISVLKSAISSTTK